MYIIEYKSIDIPIFNSILEFNPQQVCGWGGYGFEWFGKSYWNREAAKEAAKDLILKVA